MQFNSFAYLVFLAVAVVLYWALPARFRRVFVLTTSVAFYATWSVVFVAIPFAVCAVIYAVSRLMIADAARARRWMWLGIGFALSVLAFFKYRDFALANFNVVLAWMRAQPLTFGTAIALPLGISFYTFEAISYLIDVRQGRIKKPGFLDLCLFVMFWPHLMAGPIVRARELMPQLKFNAAFEPRFVFEGLDRLFWGLVQKNVFANTLSIWVEDAFRSSAGSPSTIDTWVVAIAFGLQIYFDFAAYSNMAIGAARLLGVVLPENFRRPYHAATPPEFWSRWHMTLSRWIRDYLFFPLNAKYKGAPVPLYVSLIAVMAVVGLWHGAGWGFVLWGILHGAYLVLYRMYESFKENRPALASSVIAANAWRVFTLLGVTVAWVPFRAPTIQKALAMLTAMFVRPTGGMALNTAFYAFTAALVLFVAFEPLIGGSAAESADEQPSTGVALSRVLGRPLAYAAAMLAFMMFDQHDAQFIYFQF